MQFCCPLYCEFKFAQKNWPTMMATTNVTGCGTQTKIFEGWQCSPVWVGEFKFSAVNIFLSITVIIENTLILVALHEKSSLLPPSKLLYRCLARTDLLVGLVSHPVHASYWMLAVYEHWSLRRCARGAISITGYTLSGVCLYTMAAISVDRLLAMLLGLRYKEIVSLRRTLSFSLSFGLYV